MKDSTYLLNKEIAVLELKGVTDAQEAVFTVANQAPGQKQQIALLQSGRSLKFAKPWTVSFKNITVREAFDRIAEQFGATSGWQFGGAADFRVITFHDSISPKTSITHSVSDSAHRTLSLVGLHGVFAREVHMGNWVQSGTG
jgi:hypothetical protein